MLHTSSPTLKEWFRKDGYHSLAALSFLDVSEEEFDKVMAELRRHGHHKEHSESELRDRAVFRIKTRGLPDNHSVVKDKGLADLVARLDLAESELKLHKSRLESNKPAPIHTPVNPWIIVIGILLLLFLAVKIVHGQVQTPVLPGTVGAPASPLTGRVALQTDSSGALVITTGTTSLSTTAVVNSGPTNVTQVDGANVPNSGSGAIAVIGITSAGTAIIGGPVIVGGSSGGNSTNLSIATTGGGGVKTDLTSVGGTALTGANVIDGGNTAFRVNCVTGCAASSGTNINQVDGAAVPNSGSGALAVVGITSTGTVIIGGPVIVGGSSGGNSANISISPTGGGGVKTDMTSVGGTATDANTGNATAGTQRVVLASNQPVVSVQGTVGGTAVQANFLTANIATNLAQVGGTNVSGANVVDAGNTAFRVNCVTGCSGSSGTNITQVDGAAVPNSGSGALAVVGITSTGVAIIGGPVIVGGSSGGNSTNISISPTGGGGVKIDQTSIAGTATVTAGVNGLQAIGGAAANGAALSGNPVLVAGGTGGNAQTLTTDANGRLMVVGGAASGQIPQGAPLLLGASDGTNVQTLKAESAANPNLKIALFNGANEQPAGDALARGIFVNIGMATGATFVTPVADPCQTSAGITLSDSITTSTTIITGTAAKLISLCSVAIYVNGVATNWAMPEGTGTLCATNLAKFFMGGTTAAAGPNFVANQGIVSNGIYSLATQSRVGDNVCLLLSAANQVNYNIRYVVQ